MVKVITYGTFDLLHYGHVRLLERAKALGDYLIVGVTADDFDKVRGKINVQQSLMERVEAVRATGLADEIIIEEYEGQKIDDILRYNVDIFTVGSDWVGVFDYLNEYCKVVYLDRTQGVSSTEIRSQERKLRLGFLGQGNLLMKHIKESSYVNGIELSGVCTEDKGVMAYAEKTGLPVLDSYSQLLEESDAVYIVSHPTRHYEQVKQALCNGTHVLCESPIALTGAQLHELEELAREKGLVLMEALKTAYCTAYNRLLLLLKSGKIGKITSVDTVCTSLHPNMTAGDYAKNWNSMCSWGPTAMLPVFQILGVDYKDLRIVTKILDQEHRFDAFSKMEFIYPDGVASAFVGKGVKREGELVVSGTEGYAYVPAPWWKTDYFELRYENASNNRRYFFQLDGEGVRYEIVAFTRAVQKGSTVGHVSQKVSNAIVSVIEDFYEKNHVVELN